LTIKNFFLNIEKTSVKYIALPASLPSGLNNLIYNAPDSVDSEACTAYINFYKAGNLYINIALMK